MTSLAWGPHIQRELAAIERLKTEQNQSRREQQSRRAGRKPTMFVDKLFLFRVHYGANRHVKDACAFADISFRYAKRYMTSWGMQMPRELQGHRFHRDARGYYLRGEPVPILELTPRWMRPKDLAKKEGPSSKPPKHHASN